MFKRQFFKHIIKWIVGEHYCNYGDSPGIERDKTMAYKMMYIHNDDTQNYPYLYIIISGLNVCTLNRMNQPIKFNKNPQSCLAIE